MAQSAHKQFKQNEEFETVQCRMARAALGWGLWDLAGAAGVSSDTVARFERGHPARLTTVRAIKAALENAGCEFVSKDDVGGPGMRMRKKQVHIGG